ncbi:hypothetical protein [Lactobacillus sp.]|uniref:hypothetical protein n=1 Tax=Lactobacillus sp. TaxID=1591 RepID=UPI0019BB041A|nr:hypothetical protein [Lactobacillus sp.]MBD5429337.1 hypothetical protein [Lactobacillus sp.]MBD5430006.1 hypothetical protein [Lactobacillus sp.]
MASSYWKQRLAQEKKWQEQQDEADVNFDTLIEKRYRNVINDIDDLIDREVSRLNAKTGTNYSQMMKDVTTGDIERFEAEAEKLVKRAEEIRKSGKKVTLKDFTDEENLRMKIYNATMRINRLEYLKSMTGAYLTHVTMDISDDLRERLTNEVIAEQKRQAGLLGKFLPDYDFKASYTTQSIVMQSMAGATWSSRLWRSQDTLKANLDRVLTTGFVTGEHPRVLARKLKDQVASTVKNATYVTERIARTESSRVQYDVQYNAIKDNGFTQAWYFAERNACKICQKYADHKYPGEDELGVYDLKDVPRIPLDTHPNCRCSISSYMSDDVLDEFIKEPENSEAPKELDDLKKVDLPGLLDKGIKDYLTEEWDHYLAAEDMSYRPLSKERLNKATKEMKSQFAKLNEMISSKENDIQMYIEPVNLKKVLKDGFKNQLETNSSGGFLDTQTRRNVEWKIFTDESEEMYEEYMKRPPEDFALYGRIGKQSSYYPRTARNYGEIAVHFNKNIKDRTTYTIGDSLAKGFSSIESVDTWKAAKIGEESPTYIAPVGGSGRKLWSMYDIFEEDNIHFMDKYKTIDDMTDDFRKPPYVEAQIHGKVTAKDIAFVEIPENIKAKSLISELEKMDIPYKIRKLSS